MKKIFAAAISLLLLTGCGSIAISGTADIADTTAMLTSAAPDDLAAGTAATVTSATALTSTVTTTEPVTAAPETATSTVTAAVTTTALPSPVTTEPEVTDTAPDSRNIPCAVFIRRLQENKYCPEKSSVSLYDSSGYYYFTEDKDICGLSNIQINEKLASGGMADYRMKCEAISTDEIAANYRLVCEAAAAGNCELDMPDRLPCVEAPEIAVYTMYYTSDGELKSVCIYKNKCMSNIFTNSEKLNEVYRWYRDTFRKAL